MVDFNKVLYVGVSVLLVFVLLAAFFPSLADAGDGLTDEGMCDASPTTCFFNSSRGTSLTCTENNATASDTEECAWAGYSSGGLPVSAGLASSGFLWVLLSILVIVGVILLVMKLKGSK